MGGDVVLVKVVLQGTHTYTHTQKEREARGIPHSKCSSDVETVDSPYTKKI